MKVVLMFLMKIVLIFFLLMSISCTHTSSVDCIKCSMDEPERAKKILLEKRFERIWTIGECWFSCGERSFSTGFIARRNDTLFVGCVCESIYDNVPVVKIYDKN